MNSEPFISVIITAHNRKKYILESANSVFNQNLPRDKYEVIVVKNFSDEHIDYSLKKLGALLMLSESKNLGGKILDALKFVNGNIITILEDDDLYTPLRLQRIYQQFIDSNIGFFYNKQQFIDEEGRPISTKRALKEYSRDCPNLRIQGMGEDKLKYYNLLLRCGMYFNTSSMALRTTLIRDNGDKLRELNIMVDLLFFYMSLMSNYDLILVPEKLTKYRVSDIRRQCNGMTGLHEIASRALAEYNSGIVLREYLKGTPFQREAIIDFRIHFNSILLELINNIIKNSSIKSRKSSLFGFVKSCIRNGKYTSLVWALIAISPKNLRKRLTIWALCGSLRDQSTPSHRHESIGNLRCVPEI